MSTLTQEIWERRARMITLGLSTLENLELSAVLAVYCDLLTSNAVLSKSVMNSLMGFWMEAMIEQCFCLN